MAGRYSDIVSGMIGTEDIISGADDFDLIAGLDDDDGNDAISGSDVELIAGALAANKNKSMMQRALARKLAESATLVKERPATKGRTTPLGFDSQTPIDPGASRRIVARPQIVWKGQRLVVATDIAGSFVIEDVFVGKNSQFAATGPIPARTFEPNAFGVDLEWDTAQIGQEVVLVVSNISSTPTRFFATVIGRSVE